MKQIMNVTRGVVLPRPLAVLVVAAGFTMAGCANSASDAPGASPTEPSPPGVSARPPAESQPSTLSWARSMCQALGPTFNNLKDAVTQLQAANANDAAALGQAFGAASNVISLFSTLASEPQLRVAIDQARECQTLASQPPS